MRLAPLAALGLAAVAAADSRGDEPAAKPPAPTPAPRAADGDAPLAEGWPGATRPGAVEVKRYPAYRSAVARARGASPGADGVLFWPLFRHITARGVEMTAPVVSTYDPATLEAPEATGDVSMEFVYRGPTLGQAGPGVGAVRVEDHPAASYVCLGIQGGMGTERLRDGVRRLRAWLDANAREWVADGPPRRLGYHGPMTPAAERLWEIQIPVKPAAN